MRVLTDGYVKLNNERLTLSGEAVGAPEYASEIISELRGGGGKVYFKPTDSAARELLEKTFGDVYKESDEGYIISISEDITVYADTPRAMIYAANSILAHYEDGIGKGLIYNYPSCPHRSARVFLPPKGEMVYFKKFIDTLVYHGFNCLVLEVGGCMEYESHPEINDYWRSYSAEFGEFNGKTYMHQISKRIRNSVHTYNAGGDVYSKKELRELSEYCKRREIEIIPEIPTLTHCEYLLGAHPELAECDDEFLPDTCCPQNEKLYEIIFELYDEAIEVFAPKALHIGHDEWWTMCICDKCRGKDPARLFANSVNKCTAYLTAKGVETVLWGDKMLELYEKTGEAQAGAYKKIYSADSGKTVTLFGRECTVYEKYWFDFPDDIEERGAIPHEMLCTKDSVNMINPSVKVMDWQWATEKDKRTPILERGLWTVYGNAKPSIMSDWDDAIAAGVQGLSVSSWILTDEIHLQKYSTLFNIGYGALMLWARDFDSSDFEGNVMRVARDMYFYRNKDILKAPHIEIIHSSDTVADKNEALHRPYIEKSDIKMGEYVIEYENGEKDIYEVLFNSNVGPLSVSFERSENRRNYIYDYDRRIGFPIAVCDYIKDGGEMWYKVSVPTSSKVKTVKYIPLDEYKDNLHIKEISYKNFSAR